MDHSEDSDSAKMSNSDAPLPIYRRPKDDKNDDTSSTLNLSGDTVQKDHLSAKGEDMDISQQPRRLGPPNSRPGKSSTSIAEPRELNERDIFIVCSSWMRTLGGDHQTYKHMVDIVIRFYDFPATKPTPGPRRFYRKVVGNTMGNSLYEDLSRFLKTLPPRSKRHIWEHAVRIRTPDGKRVCDSTQSRRHINRLLCDLVIVYIKYLDRDRKPLPSATVRPHKEPVAQFIHLNYHSIQRGRFENDTEYFPQMLDEYVQSQIQ